MTFERPVRRALPQPRSIRATPRRSPITNTSPPHGLARRVRDNKPGSGNGRCSSNVTPTSTTRTGRHRPSEAIPAEGEEDVYATRLVGPRARRRYRRHARASQRLQCKAHVPAMLVQCTRKEKLCAPRSLSHVNELGSLRPMTKFTCLALFSCLLNRGCSDEDDTGTQCCALQGFCSQCSTCDASEKKIGDSGDEVACKQVNDKFIDVVRYCHLGNAAPRRAIEDEIAECASR